MTSSLLFESFDDLPAAWREICRPDDLAMDQKILSVFQRTLAGQCRCWGVIVFDESSLAIGCAALCMFQTELIESTNRAVLRWREKMRRIFPNFARMKVLFCGLPIPSGSTHFRVRPSASVEAVFREIDLVMQQLAVTTRSRLMVFKELDSESVELATVLKGKGYMRGEIPPMHLLDASFHDFGDYLNSMKSRYRLQIQRSQKKLVAAGFEVLQGNGNEFFREHFTEEVHQLYVAVQSRAEQKLELLPREFFLELAAALGDEALLTLIRRDGRVFAFTFAISRGKTYYNMYSGLDYALNNAGDLYFNLFYNDMDQAFRRGATSLHFGQTSDSFKSRLGTRAQKLWFFARARPSFFNIILRIAAPLAFPKVMPVESNDIFIGRI